MVRNESRPSGMDPGGGFFEWLSGKAKENKSLTARWQ